MIGAISGVGGAPYSYAVSPYALSRRGGQERAVQNVQTSAGVLGARRSASLETPVQPVTPARAVSADEASIPVLLSRMENDPAAMAGRMRVRYGDVTPESLFMEKGKNAVQGPELAALEGRLSKAEDALARNGAEGTPGVPEELLKNAKADRAPESEENAQGVQGAQKALEEGECQTCKERKYQDGSDDPGVSFKTPTNIAPEQAASAVRGHEMEHVYREQAKADRENRRVVSQTVTMHTEICPECGKAYVSGGTTRTVTKAETDDSGARQEAAQKEKERTPFSAVA